MITNILIIAFVLLIIDLVFLSTVLGPLFGKMVEKIQGSPMKLNILGAILSYTFITIGIYQFGLKNMDDNNIITSAILGGGLFGLLSYGIFDFTNLAIFKEYQWSNAIIDTIWGGILCFTVTILSYLIKNYFNL